MSRSGYTGGKFLGVADLAHAGDDDGSDRHDRRGRRAGERREHHAGKDRRDGQATLKMADDRNRKTDDPARDTAGGHENRRQNEERDRQQGEVTLKGGKER